MRIDFAALVGRIELMPWAAVALCHLEGRLPAAPGMVEEDLDEPE